VRGHARPRSYQPPPLQPPRVRVSWRDGPVALQRLGVSPQAPDRPGPSWHPDAARAPRSTRQLVQAALQKRGAEARSALVWAAVTGDAEAAAALLGWGARLPELLPCSRRH
jgi:hypothetical protein